MELGKNKQNIKKINLLIGLLLFGVVIFSFSFTCSNNNTYRTLLIQIAIQYMVTLPVTIFCILNTIFIYKLFKAMGRSKTSYVLLFFIVAINIIYLLYVVLYINVIDSLNSIVVSPLFFLTLAFSYFLWNKFAIARKGLRRINLFGSILFLIMGLMVVNLLTFIRTIITIEMLSNSNKSGSKLGFHSLDIIPISYFNIVACVVLGLLVLLLRNRIIRKKIIKNTIDYNYVIIREQLSLFGYWSYPEQFAEELSKNLSKKFNKIINVTLLDYCSFEKICQKAQMINLKVIYLFVIDKFKMNEYDKQLIDEYCAVYEQIKQNMNCHVITMVEKEIKGGSDLNSIRNSISISEDALFDDGINTKSLITHRIIDMISSDFANKSSVNYIESMNLKVYYDNKDIVCDQWVFTLELLRISDSVISNFYRIIRLFDFFIHIQTIYELNQHYNRCKLDMYMKNLGFPSTGRWLEIYGTMCIKNDYLERIVSKNTFNSLKKCCEILKIGFECKPKKMNWKHVFNTITSIRNKTVGHGIVTSETSCQFNFILLKVATEYMDTYVDAGIEINEKSLNNHLYIRDGKNYIFCGSIAGQKEYFDYKNGYIYSK